MPDRRRDARTEGETLGTSPHWLRKLDDEFPCVGFWTERSTVEAIVVPFSREPHRIGENAHCNSLRHENMTMLSRWAEHQPFREAYALIQMWSQGLSTVHDAPSTPVTGAITPGKTSFLDTEYVCGRPASDLLRESTAPALTAAIACSGRCTDGQCGDPASDSGTKDGFAAWMGGSRSSLDAFCCMGPPSQQARGGKAW